jgi:hypothetical protein
VSRPGSRRTSGLKWAHQARRSDPGDDARRAWQRCRTQYAANLVQGRLLALLQAAGGPEGLDERVARVGNQAASLSRGSRCVSPTYLGWTTRTSWPSRELAGHQHRVQPCCGHGCPPGRAGPGRRSGQSGGVEDCDVMTDRVEAPNRVHRQLGADHHRPHRPTPRLHPPLDDSGAPTEGPHSSAPSWPSNRTDGPKPAATSASTPLDGSGLRSTRRAQLERCRPR